jgi:hypothetical protein
MNSAYQQKQKLVAPIESLPLQATCMPTQNKAKSPVSKQVASKPAVQGIKRYSYSCSACVQLFKAKAWRPVTVVQPKMGKQQRCSVNRNHTVYVQHQQQKQCSKKHRLRAWQRVDAPMHGTRADPYRAAL